MLLYYVAGTINVIVGKEVFPANAYWVKEFSETCNYTINGTTIEYSFFGNNVNIYAHLILIYALLAVVALGYLFAVILSKRNNNNSAILSYIIEEFVAVDLALYILMYLCSIDSPTWSNYGVLIAFSAVLVVTIVQMFINKGGFALVKFFLFLLSAIGVLSLYDITLYLPILATPITSLANSLQTSVGFIASCNGYIFIDYFFLDTDFLSQSMGGYNLAVNIELIALILATLLAVFNFFVDLIGLSTHSKRNAYGKLLKHKASKIFGLTRYLLEFVAVLVGIVFAFISKEVMGVYIYLLAIVALIQTIIAVVRVARLGSKIYQNSEVTKIKKTKKVISDNRLVFSDELFRGDYYEEIEVVSPAFQAASAATTLGGSYYVPSNKNNEGFMDIVEIPSDIYSEYYSSSAQNNYAQSATYPQTNGANNEPTHTIIYTARTIYNGPRDKFIDGLSDEQKVEFCRVFLEKTAGPLPDIPDYRVGGDNIKFFRSVFSHLNTFKALLSDGLLDKIYHQIIANR
jgi:hypothetical protein